MGIHSAGGDQRVATLRVRPDWIGEITERMPGMAYSPDGGGWACRDASRQEETAGLARSLACLSECSWVAFGLVTLGADQSPPDPKLRPDGLDTQGALLCVYGVG